MSLERSAEPPRDGVSPAAGTSRSAGEPAHPGVALGAGSGEPSEHAAKRSRVAIPETIASDSPPSFLKRPYPRSAASTDTASYPQQFEGAAIPEQKGVKRLPDVDVVDLEEEIKKKNHRTTSSSTLGRYVLVLRCIDGSFPE